MAVETGDTSSARDRASVRVRGRLRWPDLPEDAVVAGGEELTGLVRLVETLRIAGQPVEEPMEGAVDPQSEAHPGAPDGRVQRPVPAMQIASHVRRGAVEGRRPGELPAPPSEMGHLCAGRPRLPPSTTCKQRRSCRAPSK